MNAVLSDFLALARHQHGHFQMESALHSRVWMDLNDLFRRPDAIAPHIDALAAACRSLDFDIVCGPLMGGAFLAQALAARLNREFVFTQRNAAASSEALFGTRYALPDAFRPAIRGRRVLIVDDVMNAGSAVRGTHAALRDAGAHPVAAGALLLLGDVGARWCAQQQLPVASAHVLASEIWEPSACPLCAAGIALTQVHD